MLALPIFPGSRRDTVGPRKGKRLCGERKSQDTAGIFRLRKMQHCILCFDELSAYMSLTSVFGMGSELSAASGRSSEGAACAAVGR